ncbi:unnamed protein product [Soboliphyme baturini]|uniref:Uncharacterized protein n=1 Tax=Soboliphyme baturini TaxID=241478 RepID=A0A183J6Z0_9BILA|nr:unnamed protein product [Soboliphyme baturini]
MLRKATWHSVLMDDGQDPSFVSRDYALSNCGMWQVKADVRKREQVECGIGTARSQKINSSIPSPDVEATRSLAKSRTVSGRRAEARCSNPLPPGRSVDFVHFPQPSEERLPSEERYTGERATFVPQQRHQSSYPETKHRPDDQMAQRSSGQTGAVRPSKPSSTPSAAGLYSEPMYAQFRRTPGSLRQQSTGRNVIREIEVRPVHIEIGASSSASSSSKRPDGVLSASSGDCPCSVRVPGSVSFSSFVEHYANGVNEDVKYRHENGNDPGVATVYHNPNLANDDDVCELPNCPSQMKEKRFSLSSLSAYSQQGHNAFSARIQPICEVIEIADHPLTATVPAAANQNQNPVSYKFQVNLFML